MNKLYILFALLFGTSLHAMHEHDLADAVPVETGWYVTNTTDSPIFLGWYRTRLSTFPGLYGRTPWGNKQALAGFSLALEPNEQKFMAQPPAQGYWDGYRTRRELLLIQQPALLTEVVAADDDGRILLAELQEAITVVPNYELPVSDPLETPSISLVKPVGSAELRIVSKGVVERTLWTFRNESALPLFCGWYEAPWDYTKKAFLNPELMAGQVIVQLDPKGQLSLPFPVKRRKPSQRQLLISFAKGQLAKVVNHDEQGDLPRGVLAATKHDLVPYNSVWSIFNEEGKPYLSSLSNLISFVNTINEPLFAAMYYISNDGTAQKFGPTNLITTIEPQLSSHIQFPPKDRAKGTRELLIAVAEDQGLLRQKQLTADEVNRLYRKHFSKTNLINWYFQGAYNILHDVTKEEPYNFKLSSMGGGASERLIRKAGDIKAYDPSDISIYESRFREKDLLFMPDRFIVESAERGREKLITERDELESEKDYVTFRKKEARKAINNLLGEEVIESGSPVPSIALVFTGGGYRAMVETIGFLRGAERAGILGCVTYLTALSGSTWAVNPLVASGLTAEQFAEVQREKVNQGGSGVRSLWQLQSNVIKSEEYAQRRFIESRYGQYHGLVGFYGHALAEALLKDITLNYRTSHNIRLSDLRANMSRHQYPLPISVAVSPGTQSDRDLVWYEFSPFYSGTPLEGGSWVDSRLFGSSFKERTITHYVPEYPLAYYMGIAGSAFALSTGDLLKVQYPAGLLASTLATLGSGATTLYSYTLGVNTMPSVCPGRPIYGQVPNISYGARVAPRIKHNPFTCLIDGGIVKHTDFRHNFSTIPALAREVDILIMCDSVAHPNSDHNSKQLLGAAEEAHALGYPFPQLVRSSIHKRELDAMQENVSSLFIEKGKPIVVYVKAKKNEQYAQENPYIKDFDPDASVAKFTDTLNFNYKPQEYDALTGLTDYIMQNENTVGNIKQAILESIKRKNVALKE